MLEEAGIQPPVREPEAVRAWPGHQDTSAGWRAQGLAQPRDVHLKRVLRALELLVSPQLVGQEVARDRLVCPEQENDEQRTQLRPADVDLLAVHADFERPEDSIVDHGPRPVPADK